MAARDASFDFKMAASELPAKDRATLDAMVREHQQARESFDADYAKNGNLYRQQEEKRLAEHYRSNHTMKPPPGVVRDIPSGDRIRQMAHDNVQHWYAETREKMIRDARKRERDFTKSALGIQERPARELDRDRDRGR